MVAAHNGDLAGRGGVRAAHRVRPPPARARARAGTDLHAAGGVDVEAGDFVALADALGV